MTEDNQRRHTRVPVRTPIDLDFDDERISCETCDLCLSGVKVDGGHHRREGEPCAVTFKKSGITQNRVMRLRGQVVRVDESGMAVLFTDMNYRTFTTLQAILLDNAADPFDVAEEFIDDLPADQ